jgi:hypothetical protein
MALSKKENAKRMRVTRKHAGAAYRSRDAARKRKARFREPRPFLTMDFETDPFTLDWDQDIQPFYVHFYSEQLQINEGFWNEDGPALVKTTYDFLCSIKTPCLIYAHNGGRFDHKFLTLDGYIEGEVMFKGSGYMKAAVRGTGHELRDSYHLLPVPLAKLNKDQFDIQKCTKKRRNANRAEIIKYCANDCLYLHEAIKVSHSEFNIKLTIGQIARETLKKEYPEIENISEGLDAALRIYMRGGDVGCPRGSGIFEGIIRYYDVNSMYPYVMKTARHPIGSSYIFRGGKPSCVTYFLHIRCVSLGVLPFTGEDKKIFKPNDDIEREYFITIHEFNMAMKYGKLKNLKILECVDCLTSTTFERWVDKFYSLRLAAEERGAKYYAANYKSLLVNGFGKFAQNPRKFMEHYVTVKDENNMPTWPPDEVRKWVFDRAGDRCWIWQRKPAQENYYNVGTAASITGAARAILMGLLIIAGNSAIYHDTDSCLTQNFEFPSHLVDQHELGKLKLEKTGDRFTTAGKKMYELDGEVRSKGVKAKPGDMARLVAGETITYRNLGPTFDKFGVQSYIKRRIKKTI